jgi:xanthine dehydrogenase YagS FAD-binding subunit
MNSFQYLRPGNSEEALDAIVRSSQAKFLAGGTNLVDLMKNGVEQPQMLIDISRLPLRAIETLPNGGVRLGALTRNAETANHPIVRRAYPLLVRAILAGASPQLRNAATNGGNLLQRTRCYYFTDPGFPACNKRNPGSGCGAINGIHRNHAILGASSACIATHPSDMAVALLVLDATVRVRGPRGERSIRMADFHRLPGDTPEKDTVLEPDELILSIDLPPSRFVEHFCYLKIRDRASYDFALVSVAAGLEMDGKRIRGAAFALGGVAHKPWRSLEGEQELVGKEASIDLFGRVADRALQGSKPLEQNAFKVELARRTIVRALATAGALS